MDTFEKNSYTEAYECITDILKCKWTLGILDAIARGIHRPGQLERALPGLTTKVLQERVHKLERYNLIRRRVYHEVPPRVEYEFTSRGKRLIELLRTVRAFAEKWEKDHLSS